MENYVCPKSFPSVPTIDEKCKYALAVVRKHQFPLYLMDEFGFCALDENIPLSTEDEFQRAFRTNPNATLGIKTGPSSGVTAFDTWSSVLVELHRDELFCGCCDVSICHVADTGDGIIKGPTTLLFRTGTYEFSHGHSIKYESLSVLASETIVSIPPVVHETCRPDCIPYFSFFSGQSLLDAEIQPLPEEIYLSLRSDNELTNTHARSPIGTRLLEVIPEGNRHNELLKRLGYVARRKQLFDSRLYEYAHALNRRVCEPPLPRREVDDQVKYILRKNGGVQ